MKTIEVSDEIHAKLIELATEMTTQNMRHTRMPHMFQIAEQKEVAAYEGQGEDIWADSDGGVLRTEEDIKDYVIQFLEENDERLFNFSVGEEKQLREEATEIYDAMLSLDEVEDYLTERGYRKVAVTTEQSFKNTFLTAKDCQEHIDKNHYHYNEPRVYLNSAWRNPEMELVSNFLCGLVGKKMHT